MTGQGIKWYDLDWSVFGLDNLGDLFQPIRFCDSLKFLEVDSLLFVFWSQALAKKPFVMAS